MAPVAEADPATLIRRLTYDLTGLPPTPEQVVSFVEEYTVATSQKQRTQVWTAWVDRYLASPEFGEKWAQHWLDLARFAETHGYDKDKLRPNAWPYRDYVIRSFNEDKSFARFVQEQVAGDVLFPGEPDGIIGLGFLAAGPWDYVGHQEVGEDKLDGQVASTSIGMKWYQPSSTCFKAPPSSAPSVTTTNLIRSKWKITTASIPSLPR